jgi:hypothetical protein
MQSIKFTTWENLLIELKNGINKDFPLPLPELFLEKVKWYQDNGFDCLKSFKEIVWVVMQRLAKKLGFQPKFCYYTDDFGDEIEFKPYLIYDNERVELTTDYILKNLSQLNEERYLSYTMFCEKKLTVDILLLFHTPKHKIYASCKILDECSQYFKFLKDTQEEYHHFTNKFSVNSVDLEEEALNSNLNLLYGRQDFNPIDPTLANFLMIDEIPIIDKFSLGTFNNKVILTPKSNKTIKIRNKFNDCQLVINKGTFKQYCGYYQIIKLSNSEVLEPIPVDFDNEDCQMITELLSGKFPVNCSKGFRDLVDYLDIKFSF